MAVLIQCGTTAILISECSCTAETAGVSQGSAGAGSECPFAILHTQSWVSQVLELCCWALVPSWQSDGPSSFLASDPPGDPWLLVGGLSWLHQEWIQAREGTREPGAACAQPYPRAAVLIPCSSNLGCSSSSGTASGAAGQSLLLSSC